MHVQTRPDAVQEWAKNRMPFLFTEETWNTFFERIDRLFSPSARQEINLAYKTAEDAFAGVKREGGGSYFEQHLRPVALILIDYLEIRDPDLIVAALHHDTLEDCKDWTYERMVATFGKRVAHIVGYCTEPKAKFAGSKEEAARLYHLGFYRAPRDVFKVKLPDRLQNLITLGSRPREKRVAKLDETEQHYMQHAREHLILLPELREVVALSRIQLAQSES